MSKQRRQQALLELISEYEIDTQEELTRRLQALDLRQHRQLYREIYGN